MKDSMSTSKDKPYNKIKVINLYNKQGQDFESILKNVIKSALSGGGLYDNTVESNRKIVTQNRAKEEGL